MDAALKVEVVLQDAEYREQLLKRLCRPFSATVFLEFVPRIGHFWRTIGAYGTISSTFAGRRVPRAASQTRLCRPGPAPAPFQTFLVKLNRQLLTELATFGRWWRAVELVERAKVVNFD